MRAVLVTEPGQVAVQEVPDPDPDGRALLAVETAGICGTDLGIVDGKIPARFPLVLGHEIVGRVLRPGEHGLVPAGTRVVVNPSTSCAHCHLCHADRRHLCADGMLLGRDGDGGFAELLSIEETQLLPIPDDLAQQDAALLQVLGTCVHAQTTFEVFPDQTAVVIGLGVSGLLMVQLLRARGVEQIVGVTRSAWKRDLAEQLGATASAPPEAAHEVVLAVSGGRGADVVVEAVGTIGTLAQSVELAAVGGTVVLFGTIGSGAAGDLPFYQLYYKELTIRNPRAARHRDYAAGIALVTAERLHLSPLWTHGFPLDHAVVALETSADASALKVALELT